MYDPLSSNSSPFAPSEGFEAPPWPTTPHSPNSPIPNLRRASSPASAPLQDKGPSTGIYGKEPQIYGLPEPGLISPRETVGSNGTVFEKAEPYLRVRITGLDRNRRDILIKLDAQTNLSNFTGTTYRNVSRSYLEFQQFYESIVHNNPQTIVPALPLAQTSAPTDEEDDRLVKIMLQRWITRVCEDQILINDEDVRSFIESDFGYQPTPRPRKKTSSGFGILRRSVPDEDEELQRARFELTKLEGQFFETAKAVDKLSLTRKALATAHSEMGNKLINVSSTEAHPPLGNALRKLGRTWHSLADLDHAQAISECVILGDSLGYQGMNARSAKETLQMRTGVLEEYQAAVKTTISKRRHIERLKASSNIRPERVDEALEEMEEANRYEQILAKRAEGISQNLHRALQTHNRYANDDITTALIEHARSTIMYERQLLRELEALRVDVSNAANKAVPSVNSVPKPTIVPPLEDYTERTQPAPSAPISNGFRTNVDVPTPPHTSSHTASFHPGPSPTPQRASIQQIVAPEGPLNTPYPVAPRTEPLSAASSSQSFASRQGLYTASPQLPSNSSLTPQSPAVGSPSPVPSQGTMLSSDGPPLGGRLVDGSKSMFVKPISASHQGVSSTSVVGGPIAPLDPLRSDNFPRATTPSLERSQSPASAAFDPLGQIKPHQMSQSLRVQPSRPRLDPREAASKLANMF